MKVIFREGEFKINIENDEINGITIARLNDRLNHTWFRVRHVYAVQDMRTKLCRPINDNDYCNYLRGNINLEDDMNKTLHVLNETFKTLSGDLGKGLIKHEFFKTEKEKRNFIRSKGEQK